MRRFSGLLLAMSVVVVTGTSAAHAADYTIVLDKMQFGAVPAELHVGDTIVWQNHDIFRHSATARDKSFDIDLPPKAVVTMVLHTPGEIEVYCKFHPGMTASVTVSP